MNARKSTVGLIFAFLLLVESNLACGLISTKSPIATPETPAPPVTNAPETPAPPVTNAPIPPTSTNTPVPTETATPNLQATQAAQHEQTIRSMLKKFQLPSDSGSLGWFQNGVISVVMSGPTNIQYKPFAEDVNASDFVLYTEMTWKTNAWPVCGAWFRADKNWDKGDNYALQFLRFSGLPAWDIEYVHEGNYVNTVTEEVKYSKFLSLEDGATNKIVLAAKGDEFSVYINDNFIGRYYDYSSKLMQGGFAFMGNQPSGDTTCTFANSWLWVYK